MTGLCAVLILAEASEGKTDENASESENCNQNNFTTKMLLTPNLKTF